MSRRSVGRLVAGALVAAALVTAGWLTRAPDAARVAIEGFSPGRDGSALEVSLTYSSCAELDRVDVDEDGRTVRLAAYVHARPSCGTAPQTSQVVTVPLRAPLRDRSVLDRDTHASLPRTG